MSTPFIELFFVIAFLLELPYKTVDMTIPGFMLVKEAATVLGVSEQRVRQLTGNGKLPSQKVGPALIIPITAINERRVRQQVEERQRARRAKKSNTNGHK